MLRIFEQLTEIKANGRQRDKIALLKRYDSPTMRDVLFHAFSPTITFGVGTVKYDSKGPSLTSVAPDIGEFLSLIQRLASRDLTGGDANRAVIHHVNSYPSAYRELVASFFAGKMSIGCDCEIINKALPGVIPVFGVQLAREFCPDHMSYPAFVSAKLDGMRCLLFVTYAGVKLLTRTGKPIECLQHIENAFATMPLGVYDGELLHEGGNFAETISICRKSTPSQDSMLVQFHVFDYIPLPEWDSPITPAKLRFHRLDEIYERYISTTVNKPAWFVVQHTVVKNSVELARFHDIMIGSGWEGTMVQFDKPYSKKRTYDLMKLKEFTSTEAQVISVEPGTGKYKKMMGALVCEDTKSRVVFKCGSGFSNGERALPPEHWIGRVIEVKYQELTDDNKPRFPTFLRLRDDLTKE